MVGADGANSQVRKLGGFGSWGWGYGQEAVVCTVKVTPRDTAKRPEGNPHIPPPILTLEAPSTALFDRLTRPPYHPPPPLLLLSLLLPLLPHI